MPNHSIASLQKRHSFDDLASEMPVGDIVVLNESIGNAGEMVGSQVRISAHERGMLIAKANAAISEINFNAASHQCLEYLFLGSDLLGTTTRLF